MTTLLPRFAPGNNKLYARAATLALITILYNIAEGLVSVLFGMKDESMSLFGFGLDSFVEVVSGIGIWHMIRRIRRNGGENPDQFEQRALRITGTAFYVLTAGLAITSIVDLSRGHRPESTFWGMVVSVVSIVSMWALIRAKVKVGRGPEFPGHPRRRRLHAGVSAALGCLAGRERGVPVHGHRRARLGRRPRHRRHLLPGREERRSRRPGPGPSPAPAAGVARTKGR